MNKKTITQPNKSRVATEGRNPDVPKNLVRPAPPPPPPTQKGK